MSAIRFIVETTSSKYGIYGNSSHFCRVTSTATGKSCKFYANGRNNGRCVVKSLTKCDSSAIFEFNTEVPVRQWNKMVKAAAMPYEHNVTAEMFLNLEISE